MVHDDNPIRQLFNRLFFLNSYDLNKWAIYKAGENRLSLISKERIAVYKKEFLNVMEIKEEKY